jgi:hypothetical protein
MASTPVRKGRFPLDVVNLGGTAGAIVVVVAAGAGLSAMLPEPSPWLTAAAYLAPGSLAFAAYWWIAQKL